MIFLTFTVTKGINFYQSITITLSFTNDKNWLIKMKVELLSFL